ncbi:hypothetical protein SCP_0203900 [Sparassis crispa]|uniref:Uncharacterized protein n=1 Tax=Sparassis crispa TaxID=139825 RepID=A0A401GAM3_9APHY|nr:hypothetical protein SCP_0203900 [Sparassis crispa]GBE79193.1 hypothetical protein SCP_0203900 [Sparassis crispa]
MRSHRAVAACQREFAVRKLHEAIQITKVYRTRLEKAKKQIARVDMQLGELRCAVRKKGITAHHRKSYADALYSTNYRIAIPQERSARD